MPKQLKVKIRVKKSVDYFSDLTDIAIAFHDIDLLTASAEQESRLRSEGPDFLYFDSRHNYVAHRAKIVSFEVKSPPLIITQADLTYIAALVTIIFVPAQSLSFFLANYDKIEQNLPLVLTRLQSVVDKFSNLSSEMKTQLQEAVKRSVDLFFLRPTQRQSARTIKMIEDIRKKLGISEDENTPEINFTDDDSSDPAAEE